MQDIQNIPNPDVNSTVRDDDFGSHSEIGQERQNDDIERSDEGIPVPPDRLPANPVEEPPDMEKPEIEEDEDEPKRIL